MPFTAEQLRNASIIYQVGRSMGLGNRDIQIALITAMVESNLVNVNYGDRDSLGLFQQRPSMGWGTPEQVMDPYYSARKFYSTMLSMLGERRFSMDMGAVAQAVQRSAYPSRYGERIPAMRSLWPQVAQGGGEPQYDVDGNPYPLLEMTVQQTPTLETIDLPGAEAPADPATSMLDAPGGDLLATPGGAMLESGGGLGDAIVGEWGGGVLAPTEQQATPGQFTFLSTATNQIIQEISQTQGPYGKGVDGWRKAVIEAARSALGTPYVWGGTTLSSGVDCSGLIMSAFARAGLQLPRISYQQANFGQRVGYDGLQPGDLVAWDNSSRNPGADHIALYLGNGMIIEAARPGTVVRIRSVGQDLDGGWGVHLNF